MNSNKLLLENLLHISGNQLGRTINSGNKLSQNREIFESIVSVEIHHQSTVDLFIKK